MVIITFVLQLLVCIIVIVFIIYAVRIHRHINEYIKSLEKILKDHQIYFTKEIEFRNSITEILDKNTNLFALCYNTNMEVISKLHNVDKNTDNKYNVLSSKLNTIQKEVEDVHKDVTLIQNKAKFSYNTKNMKSTSLSDKIRKNELKSARNWNYSKDDKNGNK